MSHQSSVFLSLPLSWLCHFLHCGLSFSSATNKLFPCQGKTDQLLKSSTSLYFLLHTVTCWSSGKDSDWLCMHQKPTPQASHCHGEDRGMLLPGPQGRQGTVTDGSIRATWRCSRGSSQQKERELGQQKRWRLLKDPKEDFPEKRQSSAGLPRWR